MVGINKVNNFIACAASIVTRRVSRPTTAKPVWRKGQQPLPSLSPSLVSPLKLTPHITAKPPSLSPSLVSPLKLTPQLAKLQIISLPLESQTRALIGHPSWISTREAKYLCWLAQRINADVVEIGCNEGMTTREFAAALPHRTIHAVDWTGPTTMCDRQRGEQIGSMAICRVARDLPNVRVYDLNSQQLCYSRLFPAARFVFIDGDHTEEGVRKDTQLAIEALVEKSGPWAIIWHDATETRAVWQGVLRFLEQWHPPIGKVERIAGTWLAQLVIN